MHLKSDLLLHPVIQKGLFFFLRPVKRHGHYVSDCTYTNYTTTAYPGLHEGIIAWWTDFH